MNYLKEEKSFYDWLMMNRLSVSAHALWQTLMQFNNRSAVMCEGVWLWKVEFRVPNQMLVSIMDIPQKNLERARNELIQAGRISYKKAAGRQSGIYEMIPFDALLIKCKDRESGETVWKIRENVAQGVAQDVAQPVAQGVAQPVVKPVVKSGDNLSHQTDSYDPIIINNKHKQNRVSVKGENAPHAPKKNVEKKQKYSERGNVLLTESEYAALCRDFPNADEAIAYLDEHIEMKGYTAKSHYLALRKWVFDALREQALRKAETDEREKRLAAKSSGAQPGSDRLSFDLDAIYEVPSRGICDGGVQRDFAVADGNPQGGKEKGHA